MFNRFTKRKRIFAIILCALCITMLFSGCSSKMITGNEWLLKQKECLDTIEAFADGMDEVYALYIMGSMAEEDFLIELRLLKAQYNVLDQYFRRLQEENPVKEGTHSYVSKRGSEGMKKCYQVLGKIIDSSVDEDGKALSHDELAYLYLAYRQEFSAAVSEYVTAVIWLDGPNK